MCQLPNALVKIIYVHDCILRIFPILHHTVRTTNITIESMPNQHVNEYYIKKTKRVKSIKTSPPRAVNNNK